MTVPVPPGLPPLVRRAYALADDLGFPLTRAEAGPAQPAASLPGTGRFLSELAGDASQVLPGRAPFDLLFADGAWHDPAGWDSLAGLLRIGGRVVMDDVTDPQPSRADCTGDSQGSSTAARISAAPTA